MKVKLTRSQKIKLANSKDVYTIMREVLMRERRLDRAKEYFWIVCLAQNHMLLLLELVSFGAAAKAEPTDVFSFALQKSAAKLIMVHNRQEGDLVPTTANKELTEKMAAVGKFVNIPVIDHLIITEHEFFSYADTGLLKQITDNTSYDLSFEQIDKLKEQLRLSEEKALKQIKGVVTQLAIAEEKFAMAEKRIEEVAMEEKTKFAKKLLKEGLPVSKIASLTGLGKKEVEELK